MSKNGIFNDHYKSSNVLEPWDFFKSQSTLGFQNVLVGNILKYLFQAGKKENEPFLKDLKKAKAYLDEFIDMHGTVVALKELYELPDPKITYDWLYDGNPRVRPFLTKNMTAHVIRYEIDHYLSTFK